MGAQMLKKVAIPMAVASAVVVALPLFLGGTVYALDVATVALAYALFTLSWAFFCGVTGELSFGHTFFTGTAAFATAILQARYGAPPVVAVLGGAAAGGVAGCLIGLLTLRHTGAVFTMVTMAVQLTFYRALFMWSDVFGGEEGVVMTQGLFESSLANYVFVGVVAVGALAATTMIRHSRIGRQLRSAGGDTRIGVASGVPVHRVRVAGATLSGLIGGLGGSIYAMNLSMANHEVANDTLAGLIFLLATVGGARSLLGPWLVALVYVALVREWLFSLGELEPLVVFGSLLLVIWAMPQGVGQFVSKLPLWRRRERSLGGAE